MGALTGISAQIYKSNYENDAHTQAFSDKSMRFEFWSDHVCIFAFGLKWIRMTCVVLQVIMTVKGFLSSMLLQ